MTPAEKADDYLRQAGHPLADHARASIAAGNLALAFAQVRELQRIPLGTLRNACADYALGHLRKAWTPELPSRSTARFQAWAAETGWRGV